MKKVFQYIILLFLLGVPTLLCAQTYITDTSPHSYLVEVYGYKEHGDKTQTFNNNYNPNILENISDFTTVKTQNYVWSTSGNTTGDPSYRDGYNIYGTLQYKGFIIDEITTMYGLYNISFGNEGDVSGFCSRPGLVCTPALQFSTASSYGGYSNVQMKQVEYDSDDNNSYILVKGGFKIRPLYLLTLDNRFNAVNDDLIVTIHHKSYLGTNIITEDPVSFSHPYFPTLTDFERYYTCYIQVSSEEDGFTTWHNISLGVHRNLEKETIDYDELVNAFGSDSFVGKECKIRIRQYWDGITFITMDQSFYYFDVVPVDIEVNSTPQCHGGNGTITFTIGNMTAFEDEDDVQLVASLYRYSENYLEQTDLCDDYYSPLFNHPDCEIEYDGKTLYLADPYKTENIIGLEGISDSSFEAPAGYFKVKAYILNAGELLYPAEKMVHMTEPDPITLSLSAIDDFGLGQYEVQAGATSGRVNFTITGGTSPYYYGYTSSQDPDDLTTIFTANPVTAPYNPATETLTVTVTDSRECQPASETIPFRRVPELFLTLENDTSYITCHENNAGSASDAEIPVEYSGGSGTSVLTLYGPDNLDNIHTQHTNSNTTGTYTFSDNIGLGSYKITLEDGAGGGTKTDYVEVVNPQELILDDVILAGIACNNDGDTAFLQISDLNTESYTYYAEPPGGPAESSTLSYLPDLNAGTSYDFYFSKAKTGSGECYSNTITLPTSSNPPPITASESGKLNLSCTNSDNGEITIIPSGGIPFSGDEYDIKLSTDASWTRSASYTSSALSVNNYTLQIRDAQCPVVSTYDFSIDVVDQPVSVTTINGTPDLCEERISGGPSGIISLTIDPGDRPAGSYNYYLSQDGSDIDEILSTSSIAPVFSDLPEGVNYEVIVEEVATLCSSSATANIGLNPNRLRWDTPSVESENTACEGQSTGSLLISALDGYATAGYTFTIENTEEGINQSTVDVSGTTFTDLPAGEYTITVEDDSTCFITEIHSIGTNDSPIRFTISDRQNNYCDDLNIAHFTLESNSIGSSISSLELLGQTFYESSHTWSGLDEGNYLVEATDDDGCSDDTLISIINLNNNPVVSVDILDSVACNGVSNGRIQLSASQAISFDEFDFELGGYLASDPSTVEFDNLATGEYDITVTDSVGCFTETTVLLSTINQPTFISDFKLMDASCIRAANAGVHLEASGGMTADPGYYFVLNSTDTIIGQTVDFTDYPVGGNNRVGLYDSFGCFNETMAFAFPVRSDSLNINIVQTIDASCPGISDGKLHLQALNGNPSPGGYYYRVLHESDLTVEEEGYGNASAEFTNIAGGEYLVEVTDDDNCLALSDAVEIQEPSAPVMNVTPGYVAQKGGSTGWISAEISEGNGKYLVEWYASATADPGQLVLNETSTGTSGVTNLPAGTYMVRVQDTAGCVFWDDEWLEMITQLEEPEDSLKLELQEITYVTCNGMSDGQFVLRTTGGWGNSFLYGTDIADITSVSPVFTGYNAGSGYTFYTSDSSGTIASASFDMIEPEPLSASLSQVLDANCYGIADGEVHLDITGGNNLYVVSTDQINWTNGNQITDLLAGTYTIYVRDSLDCSTLVGATVSEPEPMVITDTVLINTQCQVNEGSISATVAGGTPAYTYYWYSNTTLIDEGSSSTDSLYSGIYTLRVIDNNNCPQDFNFAISDDTDLEISSLTIEPVSCWGESDGSASIEIVNGFPPYLITWPDGSNSTLINGLPSGTYMVSVFDAEGCQVYENFTISTPDSLSMYITSVTDPLCLGVADGEIDISVLGGTPGYTFEWSNGRNREDIQNLDAGQWFVTVTDANNCQREFSCSLNYSEVISIEIPDEITICRDNTYPLDAGNFEIYAWYSDDHLLSSAQVLEIYEAGEYILDVEDARGCQTTDTILIKTSDTELGAQFLMATVVEQFDTLVVFEASVPAPDSMSLLMDESISTIDSGQYWRFIVVNDTGTFPITLVSYLNDCQDVIVKNLIVVPRDPDKSVEKSSPNLMITKANLFPNPSDGQFSLEVELSKKADISLRMVSFGNGSTVLYSKSAGNKYYKESFNLNSLMPGLYLLSIEVENEMVTKKVIIH